MSDFLTRLAERTMGLVPAAKPIITPVFAPNLLNDNLPYPVWNNDSLIPDKTESTPARENLSAFSKSDQVDETRLPDTMTGNSTFKPIQARENLSAFSKWDQVDETRLPDTVTGQNDNSNSTFIPASKGLNPETLSSYKRLKEDARSRNEHFADLISSEQNQRDDPEPEQSFKPQNDSSELQIDSDMLSITRRSMQAAPEPQHTKTYNLRSSVTKRKRPSYVATPTSSSSMPTIHVTIGRVEVKAITPPVKPAQRSRTPSPTLSLNEYLEKRNRRQR